MARGRTLHSYFQKALVANLRAIRAAKPEAMRHPATTAFPPELQP